MQFAINLQYHSHKPMTKLIFFLLKLMPLVLSSSSVSDNLSQESSLSVDKPGHVLISTNAVFSAGFHAVGVNAYCFAVWFTGNPPHHHNRTLVWVANRDQPVNGRFSKLSLLANANLILTDAGRSILWATNTVSTSSVTLRLHDTGNLVLRTSEGVALWQSFDSPTDTLLPTQPLTRYARLVSSRTQTDPSRGLYKLFFDDDNVLRLVFDGPETSSFYWPPPWLLSDEAGRSRYNDNRIAVFDFAGQFTSSDRLEFRATDFGVGPQRRLTLDFDGNLRLYSLQQEEEHGQTWVVSWQAMTTPCSIHGACGPNSLCSYDPYCGRTCSCLPSFGLKNHADWTYGCVPKMELLCNHGEEATFVKLPHVDLYGYNIRILRNYTLERCTEFCLGLCDCKGFQYRFDETEGSYDCYPKRVLRNGHRSPNFGGALYLRVPKELKSPDTNPAEEFNINCKAKATKKLVRAYDRNDKNSVFKFLIWFAGGAGLAEMICIFLVLTYLYRTSKVSRAAMDGYSLAVTGFRKFSYSELEDMTRNFSEEIGRGDGGVVYKGQLPDHRVAAIKCLDANQGEEEFLAELRPIGRLNHMNLIEMWGYCAEGKHRLLVCEFMEHGSLADNLISNTLDWGKRLDIAVGTAKGLAYLHEECLEWVLHCDVKPQNILLDTDYHPKVSDFGLSKLLSRGGDHKSGFSRVRGTRGYMAPEWIFNLPITSKVDVYSYGIVVLEMVTGKSVAASVDGIGNTGEMEQRRLVMWVRERMSSGDDAMKIKSSIEEIVDPVIKGEYDIGKIEKLVRIALQCVDEDRDARPTMSQVVEMLLPQ